MENKKDFKSLLHDAGILLAITLIAGLILGFVYELTKNPIAVQEELALQNACKEVFADANSFKDLDVNLSDANLTLEENGFMGVKLSDSVRGAYDAAGSLLGYVLTVTSSEGYGGDITFTMGIQTNGMLNGISLLSISETAGLGMRAEEVLVPQFTNKNAESFEYTKSGAVMENQIDAISGATITTKAVTKAVNAGMYFFTNVLKGGGYR